MNEYYATNRRRWDEMAQVHQRDGYEVEGFLQGGCSLRPLEVAELGDVRGKSLLHLQCHFGMDTLSWARRGARVTGVDFSEQAIEGARRLAAETGLQATFVVASVDELPDRLQGTFDVVFTSYGVLCWLQSLPRWGEVVARFLAPGGTLYIAEIHPLLQVFDDASSGLAVTRDYFGGEGPTSWENATSYASATPLQNRTSYEWTHSLADVVNALTAQGLVIEFLREHPFLCYQGLPCMTKGGDGWWHLPPGSPRLPLLFSLKAAKPS